MNAALAFYQGTNELLPGSGLLDSLNTNALWASLLWGSIGSGFLIYGWKQKAMIPLAVGLALVAVSYVFLNSALYMSLASIAILAVMFWLKKQGY
jgi:hypothetical protein